MDVIIAQVVSPTISAPQAVSTTLTFSQQLDNWHDFYIVLGGAAATLVGLLFIAISLNAELITNRAQAPLRAVASNTFVSFLLVLLYALFLLFPNNSVGAVKGAVLGISLMGVLHVLRQTYIAWRSTGHHISVLTIIRRLLLPSLAYAYIIYQSQQLSDSDASTLYPLAVVLIVLLGTATTFAWDWLVGVGQNKGDGRVAGLIVATGGEEQVSTTAGGSVGQDEVAKAEPPVKAAKA